MVATTLRSGLGAWVAVSVGVLLAAPATAAFADAAPAPASTSTSTSPSTAAPAPQAPASSGDTRVDQAVAAARAAAAAAQAAAEAAKATAEAAKQTAAAIARLAPPPPPAAPAPAPGKKPKAAWSGSLGANLISVTGNANAITSKLSAVVDTRFDGWSTELKATAAYGQTRPEKPGDPAQVTALNADVRARGDRKISGPVSAYLAAGAATDHVASIEVQGYGEAGASVVWVEHQEGKLVRLKLRTDLGFRITQENRFQYFPVAVNLPDDTIYAPRIALAFRYALTKTSVISEDVEVLPDVVNVQNLRLASTTLLGAQVAEGLALQLGFTVRYIGAPAAGKKSTDTELSAGISVQL